MVAGCYCYDIPQSRRIDYPSFALISGSRHQYATFVVGIIYSIADDKSVVFIPPAHVDNLRAVVSRINDSRRHVIVLQETPTRKGGKTSPERHHFAIPGYSSYSNAIIHSSAGCTSNVRPVSALVHWVNVSILIISASWQSRGISEIPAPYVINISVLVIVNMVVGNLVFVYPDFGLQILMVVINPTVHNGNDYLWIPLLNRPCFRHVYNFQTPELFVFFVIWDNRFSASPSDVVRLSVFHERTLFVFPRKLNDVGILGESDEVDCR